MKYKPTAGKLIAKISYPAYTSMPSLKPWAVTADLLVGDLCGGWTVAGLHLPRGNQVTTRLMLADATGTRMTSGGDRCGYTPAMVFLTRTVRFCLNDALPPAPPIADINATKPCNNYSAWPAMRGLGRYYEMHVQCAGQPDPVTGYFLNIKEIDHAVQQGVIPYLTQLLRSESSADMVPMGSLMQRVIQVLQSRLGGTVAQARLDLTRYYHLGIRSDDLDHVRISQRYEFAAAHRLHVAQYSDQQNRQTFGKCNHPSGHGHNYHVEVTVRAPIQADGQAMQVERLDTLVDQVVIQDFDHKYLNLDVPEFAQQNPSVENIAKVIHDRLYHRIHELGVVLETVRVWETEKTVCAYGHSLGQA